MRDEFSRNSAFAEFSQELERLGRLRRLNDAVVNQQETEFAAKDIRSDDPHILALAHLSGVRLLFSNDKDLHRDFKNIIEPAGSIYSTNSSKLYGKNKRELLRKNPCRST